MPGSDAWEMDDDDEKNIQFMGDQIVQSIKDLKVIFMYRQTLKKAFRLINWIEGKRLELAGKLKERLRNIYLETYHPDHLTYSFKLQTELGEM